MPLSKRARHAVDELDAAIAAGRTREVLELIASYGLSAGDRIAVVSELHRRASRAFDDELELRFGQFDDARVVRGVSEVWKAALHT